MNLIPTIFHKKKDSSARANPSGRKAHDRMIGNDPYVDWAWIVSIAFALGVILIIIGSYVYVTTERQLAGQGDAAAPVSQGVHFDVQKLKGAISVFDARATETLMLDKGYNGPRDPSLP